LAAPSFFWTSGTLIVRQFLDDLTVPNGCVLASSAFDPNHISGDLTLLRGATTSNSISDFAGGDQFQVDGHVAIDGGNLKLSLSRGFVPNSTAKLEIMTTSVGIVGSFANVANGQRIAAGNDSFLVNYGSWSPFDPRSVFISSFCSPLPAISTSTAGTFCSGNAAIRPITAALPTWSPAG
jgi:hypothetical protein